MAQGGIPFLVLLLVVALVCGSGCLAPPDTAARTTDTPPATTVTPPAVSQIIPDIPPVPEPPVAPVTTPSPAASVTKSPRATIPPTWIPKTYGRDASDDPFIERLTFVKECFIFDIPDCGMRVVFPEAAGDPAYGIRQPVPRLLMVPGDRVGAFLRAHAGEYGDRPDAALYVDPNTIGGTACASAVGSPKWNFIRINATLLPRNPRPGEYDIGINVRSHGVQVEQIRLNRTFAIDRQVVISGYIPLRLDEMDDFDTIDLVFARRE